MRYYIFALLTALTIFGTGCSSLLYQPIKGQIYDPTKGGFPPDDVYFKSEDGTKLHGWYFHSRHSGKLPKGLIVFFHGNGENLTSHFAALYWILPHGYDYFIFDYRGYDQSEGEPSPRGTMEDGKAALRWAHTHMPKTPLIVYGQSLGGAVAMRSVVEIKGEFPISLVAVDSTFASYEAAGANVMSHVWLLWPFQPLAYLLLSDRYAPDDRIKEISPIPLIVIHGTKDQIISYKLGQKVYALARNPKEFWEVPDGHHIDAFWRQDPTYRNRFLKHLDSIVKK